LKDKKKLLREYTEAIIIALIAALIIRAFVIQAFKIPSGSMEKTLLIGDHILVNKFIYGTTIPFSDNRILVFKKPERGDIIVFKYPENPKKDFIKRVVATGGDTIESKDKVIYINGEKIDEPYAQHTDSVIMPHGIGERDNFGPLTVPENKFFVMGDNRDQSHDSRFWGLVDLDEIKGEALIIYWSWNSDDPGLFNKIRFGRIGHLIE
jgi:signal peptidase I